MVNKDYIQFNSFSEVMKKNGEMDNKGITFINLEQGDVFISYRNLYIKALLALYYLQDKGILPGTELVFQIDDNETFIVYFWACIIGGIIPVPVSIGNNDEHKRKLFRILNILTKPSLISNIKTSSELLSFAKKNNLYDIASFQKQVILIEENNNVEHFGNSYNSNLGNIAFIQFSSGSTGHPKGVIVTHKNLLVNTKAVNIASQTNEDDNLLSWMPLTHDMGLICFHLSGVAAGANQFIMPTSLFIRRPVEWFEKANQYRATLLYSPNFGYKHFLTFLKKQKEKEWDLSCVRLVLNGAEPISASLCNDFLKEMSAYKLKRNSMFPVYGLAEATVGVSSPPVGEEFKTIKLDRSHLNVGDRILEIDSEENKDFMTFVSVGYPINWCNVRICNNEDKKLEDGVIGNIQLSGDNITSGYYNHKDNKGIFSSDGWLKTGDLGFIRDGRLVITGRAKDIIFINGQNYYPHDIESLAEEIDGIELGKIAVCGVYDKSTQNESVIAFVLYKGDMEQFGVLRNKLRNHIVSKVGVDIKRVIPIKRMSKTTSGKIERYKLRERFLNGEFDEVLEKIDAFRSETKADIKPVNDVEAMLLEICREEFNNKEIDVGSSFTEFGADSLIISKLHSRIEQIYPDKITVADLYSYSSIAQIARILLSKKRYLLEGIEFSEGYIKKQNQSSGSCSLRYIFPEHTFKRLIEITKVENICVFDVTAAFYVYLLSSLSNKQLLTIYILNNNESEIYPLKIDVSQFDSFNSLVRSIATYRTSNNKGIPLSDWTSIITRNESGIIIPLLSEGKSRNINISLIEKFDLVFTIQQEECKIGLLCEFNNHKLGSQDVKNLISSFVSIISYATDESK